MDPDWVDVLNLLKMDDIKLQRYKNRRVIGTDTGEF